MLGRLGVVLGLGVLSFVVLGPNRPAGRVPDEDAGVFLYVAQRILDGELPYRDVWDHKPPLIYYIDALGLALRSGLDGVWALQLVGLWGAAVLLVAALTPTLGRLAAVFAAVTLAISVPRFVLSGGLFTNFTELFGLPLQTAALALVALERGPSVRASSALMLGIVGGVTFALKPPLVGLWVAAVLCSVVMLGRSSGAVPAGRRLATVAAGALLPPFALLAYFALCGVVPELVDQAITYNGVYVSSSTLAERADAIIEGARFANYGWLPLLAALGAAIAAGQLLSGARHAIPPIVWIALTSLPIVIPLAGASGNAYGIYALPWLPSLAVLGGHAAASLMKARAPTLTKGAVRSTATIVLLAVLAIMSVRPAGLLWRGATTGDDGRVRAAAMYVVEHTAPDDRVLIWGARTEVLVLAERRAPTRFVYQYAPLYTVGYQRLALTEELLRDLERERPLLIIDATTASPQSIALTTRDLGHWDPQDTTYAAPPGIERVLAFVGESYVQVGTVADGWPVYRLVRRG